jgi:hypothetical protein
MYVEIHSSIQPLSTEYFKMLGTLGEKENASFWLNYMPSTILG